MVSLDPERDTVETQYLQGGGGGVTGNKHLIRRINAS